MRTSWFVAVLLLLEGCSRFPEYYPPPEQRKPISGSEPAWMGAFVNMADPAAEVHLVKDINTSLEASWRWAYRRPELQFFLESVENLKFTMDFAIPDAVIGQTGPLTFSYFVNEQLLTRVRYVKAGQYRFEQPVPAKLLRPQAVNRVAIQPDKVYVAEADGAQLSFILSSAGFVE